MKHDLYNEVFRFFRYENGGEPLLDNKTFKFGENIEPKDKQTLITSLEQVGKTFLTLPVALIYLSLNIPVVYLVMDKNQKRQVCRRLFKIMNNLYSHLQILNFKEENIHRFNPDSILYYDSMNKCEGNDLENALNDSYKARFIFVIKEHTQIKRINNYTNKDNKIVLILDEVHKTGAYKKDEDVYHSENVLYDEAIVELKENSQKIINVSATAQDFLMVSEIYSDNIVYITPSENHTGIKDWVWDNAFTTRKDKKEDIIPDSVLKILEKKTYEDLIVRYDMKNKKVDKHPHIVLCKYYRKLDRQKEMLEWFQSGIGDFAKYWTVIIYQGEGITLYSKSLGSDPVYIENEDAVNQKSVFRDGAHYFSSYVKNSIGISDCLQYLAEGGVEMYSKILIIGFDMCCEGISYTSHYNKPHNWHLTSIIAKFPSNSTAALQKQVLSRVNGNHGDDIKPIVCVDTKVKEKVLYSHEMCEKQIFECISLSQIGNIKLCSEHLNTLQYFKNRVPNNHYKIKTISSNTIQNPNAKKERKLLRSTDKSIEILYTIDPSKYEKTKSIMDEKYTQSEKEKLKISHTNDNLKSAIITTTTTTTITITKTVSLPIKTIDESYYLIDPKKLRKDSIQYLIISETIKQIIKNKEVGNSVLRSTINKWLLSTENTRLSNTNHINGNFDSGILPKMQSVESIKTNGLLYWKNNDRFYLRLNVNL